MNWVITIGLVIYSFSSLANPSKSTIVCNSIHPDDIEYSEENTKVSKIEVHLFYENEFRMLNAKILDDQNRVLLSYASGLAHSGGGGQGWFDHPSVLNQNIMAHYYSRDYCIDYKPIMRRIGPWYNRRDIFHHYECDGDIDGREITIQEVTPVPYQEDPSRDFNIKKFINKIEVKDEALKRFGLRFITRFKNCQ